MYKYPSSIIHWVGQLRCMFDTGPHSSPPAHSSNFDFASFPSLTSPFRITPQIKFLYSNLYLWVFFGEITEKTIVFHNQVFQLCTYLHILVMNGPYSLQPQDLCTSCSFCLAYSPLAPPHPYSPFYLLGRSLALSSA